MAGRGPAPKDPAKRARTNKDPIPQRVVDLPPAGAQEIPNDLLEPGEEWHPATLRWWQRWSESSLSDTWTEVDWSVLEQTAVLHHEYMRKRTFTLGSELRLREAKMGATPEDRARLRIVAADADDKDEKRAAKRSGGESSRQRYAGLRAVPTGTEE